MPEELRLYEVEEIMLKEDLLIEAAGQQR